MIKKYIFMCFVVIVSCVFVGCIDMRPEASFDDVNVVYDVRYVYVGHEGGYSIIMVEYYDGNVIKTVDNQMKFGYRRNRIDVKRSVDGSATLRMYAINQRFIKGARSWRGSVLYPCRKYVLSIPDGMNCGGIRARTYHPHHQTNESWEYVLDEYV